jgi:hypothetical protein
MHDYLVDRNLRTRVFIIVGAASIVATYLFHLLIEKYQISIPWWAETPSPLLFFGFFMWTYNVYFWKAFPFRLLNWFYIPNLNGHWSVRITSSYNNFAEPIEGTVKIRQTGFGMSISLETQESTSGTVASSLFRAEEFNNFELLYQYLNKPKPQAVETMNIHYGTAWLQISKDCKTIRGEYFSGRGRQNFGEIVYTRTSDY